MAFGIDPALATPVNARVVEFILRESPSAHSDVASELDACARGMRGVRSYCPNHAAYAYVALHTAERVIFAIAYGMRRIAFRLSRGAAELARADRGAACADIGAEWIAFDAFDSNEPTAVTRARLAKWCHVAREEAGPGKSG